MLVLDKTTLPKLSLQRKCQSNITNLCNWNMYTDFVRFFLLTGGVLWRSRGAQRLKLPRPFVLLY